MTESREVPKPDARENARSNGKAIADAMADAGVKVVCSLPETWLVGLLEVIGEDSRFVKVPVAREEEAIGILTGSYFGGQPGAILMSNSGFMTCACALNGLAMRAGIPMLLMIVQRGELGDSQVLQGNIAAATVGVLAGLGIRSVRVAAAENAGLITQAMELSHVLREPIAVLLERGALLGSAGNAYWYRDGAERAS